MKTLESDTPATRRSTIKNGLLALNLEYSKASDIIPRLLDVVSKYKENVEGDENQITVLPAIALNILQEGMVVLLDDVGFGASSVFGGPCETPVAERLADSGLQYNRFHTTVLCAPTRAALLTGRNFTCAEVTCCVAAFTTEVFWVVEKYCSARDGARKPLFTAPRRARPVRIS